MLQIPHNVEIEQAILSCMLTDNELAQESSILREDDFYSDSNRFIFKGIRSLVSKKMKVDYISLHEELGQKVNISDLSNLSTFYPIKSSFRQYIRQLKDLSDKRKLLDLIDDIRGKLFAGEDNAVDFAEKEIFKIREEAVDSDFTSPKDSIMGILEDIEKRYDSGEISGLSTGFRDLDRMTDGLQKKDFIIIAGRPSMGKTALSLNIAQKAAVNGKKVGIFSLEMSKEQLIKRMLLSESMISDLDIRAQNMNDQAWGKLTSSANVLYKANIHICDRSGLTVPEMLNKSRRLKRRIKGLDLLMIDYLQLIRGEGMSRTEQITNISIGLKSMAKELDCPLIVLSQLSRECEKRANKRPVMSDLRESGQIEQDADVIAFLYRDDYYNADSEMKNIAEVIFGKQRNGPVGTTELAFLKEIATFANLEKYKN